MKHPRRKWIIIGILVIVLILPLVAELFLRIHYGLCDAVLMRVDDDYEYIAQPNQKRKRFGNLILYNSLSMRSEELREGSRRILCLGDSILNGGTLTDHKNLATSILSQELSADMGQDIQVLNVSAGSWGPDNCLAWLNKHGHCDAEAIILVVSSHDVHDTMTFVPVVGRMKYYPVRQYSLALIELWDRYLFPNSSFFHQTKATADEQFRREHHIEKTDIPFNPGFDGIREYTQSKGIPFAIYLHATLYELQADEYEKDGQEIINYCKQNDIPLIQDLGNGFSQKCILENDYLHYSKEGQMLMVNLLKPFCMKILSKTRL